MRCHFKDYRFMAGPVAPDYGGELREVTSHSD
jgi:hypothetical protein